MKYFLIPILMLVSKIALSQIMLPAYQGVVAKIPAGAVMSCPGLATVTDVDNNSYNTVLIGSQCWMASNLRVTKYNNGALIPLDNSGGSTGDGSTETWTARTSGALTVYAYSNSNLITYGYLYNWYAAKDTREICPAGLHVPSNAEWTTLTTFLGGLTVAGGKMKSVGTFYWNSPNIGATNASGFSGLPGGRRYLNGSFIDINSLALFWSATENVSPNGGWAYFIGIGSGNMGSGYFNKFVGHSVRCLKD